MEGSACGGAFVSSWKSAIGFPKEGEGLGAVVQPLRDCRR